MKKLILWGATGQAIMLEEALRSEYQLVALFDNNNEIQSPFENVPIYYEWSSLEKWSKDINTNEYFFAVAIGGSHGKDRLMLHEKIKSLGFQPINTIHYNSYVSPDAKLAEGIQILPNATVCARVSIGKCSIINTAASIDHESIIHEGVHIGPGAKIAGCVEINKYSFIGTNSTILPRIKIGKNVIIGAGSVVTKNIPDNVIAYGNPCNIKKG